LPTDRHTAAGSSNKQPVHQNQSRSLQQSEMQSVQPTNCGAYFQASCMMCGLATHKEPCAAPCCTRCCQQLAASRAAMWCPEPSRTGPVQSPGVQESSNGRSLVPSCDPLTSQTAALEKQARVQGLVVKQRKIVRKKDHPHFDVQIAPSSSQSAQSCGPTTCADDECMHQIPKGGDCLGTQPDVHPARRQSTPCFHPPHTVDSN
jgi:hypothetical protein